MDQWKNIIAHKECRYLDHTTIQSFHGTTYTALTSFAIDDALALDSGVPSLRFWTHTDTVVLGIPDGRLPYLQEGIQQLTNHGYKAIIRNSGGLAVPLDEGVLNMSLILPDAKGLSITEAYDAMTSFIRYIMSDLTDQIEAYEIIGSYCPGDYDLSINGLKFAGISQRRVRNGAAIQIYIDVEGNSRERARAIRDFYQAAKQNAPTSFSYPDINPDVLASLSDILGQTLHTADVKQRVLHVLERVCSVITTSGLTCDEQNQFEKRYQQMLKRNEPLTGLDTKP